MIKTTQLTKEQVELLSSEDGCLMSLPIIMPIDDRVVMTSIVVPGVTLLNVCKVINGTYEEVPEANRLHETTLASLYVPGKPIKFVPVSKLLEIAVDDKPIDFRLSIVRGL